MAVQGEVTGGSRPASPSPASLCAMILGLTLFWPIASYRITPGLFLPGVEPLLDDQMTLGGLVQPLLVVVFGLAVCRLDVSGRVPWALGRASMLCVGCALLAVLAANGVAGGTPTLGAVGVVLSAAYTAQLAWCWASCVGRLDARLACVGFAASAMASVAVAAVAQAFPLIPGMSRSGSVVMLTFASGAIWCLLPKDMRGPRRPTPGRAGDGGHGARSVRIGREPVFAALVALVAFSLATSALRVLFSFDDPQGEYLYKGDASKVVALLIAATMLLATIWVTQTHSSTPSASDGRLRFPWGAFLAIILVSLYVTIVVTDRAPVLCQTAVFPCRLYAFLLSWLAVVALSRRVDRTGALAGPYVSVIWTSVLFTSRAVTFATYAALGRVRASGVDFQASELLIPTTVMATALTTAATVYFVAVSVMGLSAARQQIDRESAASRPDRREDALASISSRHELTERESQVLGLLSLGYSYKRIAEELCLSPNTVTSYVRAVYHKLGVHERQGVIDMVEGLASEEQATRGGGELRP